MKKISIELKKEIAHDRNLEKFSQIIRDKKQMIYALENEIKEIESLIEWNKNIDEKYEKEKYGEDA